MSEKIIDLKAFENQLNIKLFNDVVTFIASTTSKDPSYFIREIRDDHLWYERSEDSNIQTQYGFQYFGELLERYEEKIGTEIKDFRAIALAMATARELLTDDMFIDKQQINFIKKVRGLSANDIYLTGALYLFYKDEGRADDVYKIITQTEYTQTEDLIFVLSLLDEFERGFKIFKPQLLNLLGPARTIQLLLLRVAANMPENEIIVWFMMTAHLRMSAQVNQIT